MRPSTKNALTAQRFRSHALSTIPRPDAVSTALENRQGVYDNELNYYVQINLKTAWIDASFLYSTQEPWVAEMRAFSGGRLKETDVC